MMSRRLPLGLEAAAISTLRHFYIGESLLIRQVTLLSPLQLLLQHGCLQPSMAVYSFSSLTASLVAPCPSEELSDFCCILRISGLIRGTVAC